MEVAGEHLFRAPRPVVWQCFLDPAALRQALPGCQEFRATAPDTYAVTMAIGINELRGTYSGSVTVGEKHEPESYHLAITGSGKSGTVRGGATFTLTEHGEGALVRYVGDLAAQGMLARLGLRLLGGSAKLLIGQFMKGMEKQVEARS